VHDNVFSWYYKCQLRNYVIPEFLTDVARLTKMEQWCVVTGELY